MILVMLALATLQNPELQSRDCAGRGTIAVRCGSLMVPEDHDRPASRRIRLEVIVVPARRQPAEPDPVLLLFGGPGDFGSGRIDTLAAEHRELNVRRDLIILDQRGTGASSPIACRYGEQRLQDYLDGFLPPGFARRCREAYAERADLARYRTVDFVRDIEALRVAMRVPRLNLHGASYGTRVALQYAARYPTAVRTLILHGVVPPDLVMPASFPSDAQRALELVFDDCRGDAACNRAYPNLRAAFDSATRRLDRSSATPSIFNSATGTWERVTLSRSVFAEAVRAMLYTPATARRLPLAFHQAAAGDYGALATFALARHRNFARAGTLGHYLAVTCAEDIPRLNIARARASAAGTFLGTARLDPHVDACRDWPRRPTADEWPSVDGLQTPALMLVGDFDPVTPPAHARATAAKLRNSRVVVIPHGGHGFGGMRARDCLESLKATFLSTMKASALDVRCVDRLLPPPFALPD